MTTSSVQRIRTNIQQMSGYTPGEQLNDAIKLNTNECPWAPSPRVFTALQDIDAAALCQYPSPDARTLRQTAAAVYGCDADEVLVGNGSDDCLTIIYRSFLNAGDHIVTPWPSYGLYDTLAAIQDVTIHHHDFIMSDPHATPYTWTLPRFGDNDTDRLCLLANPNNPSGTMIPVADIVAFCRRWNGMVVVDEAYVDFARDQDERAGLIPFIQELDNLIVLRTFSKSYSLAGARVGLLFANRALITQLNKVKDSYNVNALSQIIATASLADQDHHRELVARSVASRQQIEIVCAELGWTWPVSAANFILCDVDSHGVAGDAERIYTSLKAQGILIRWWNTDQLRGCLRISVGTNEHNQRLFNALRTLV